MDVALRKSTYTLSYILKDYRAFTSYNISVQWHVLAPCTIPHSRWEEGTKLYKWDFSVTNEVQEWKENQRLKYKKKKKNNVRGFCERAGVWVSEAWPRQARYFVGWRFHRCHKVSSYGQERHYRKIACSSLHGKIWYTICWCCTRCLWERGWSKSIWARNLASVNTTGLLSHVPDACDAAECWFLPPTSLISLAEATATTVDSTATQFLSIARCSWRRGILTTSFVDGFAPKASRFLRHEALVLFVGEASFTKQSSIRSTAADMLSTRLRPRAPGAIGRICADSFTSSTVDPAADKFRFHFCRMLHILSYNPFSRLHTVAFTRIVLVSRTIQHRAEEYCRVVITSTVWTWNFQ